MWSVLLILLLMLVSLLNHMSVSIHYFEIFQNPFTCGLGCFYSFLSGSCVLYSCMLLNECADGFVSTCFICVILGASKVYLLLSLLPLWI
jgi:hypothetical protein